MGNSNGAILVFFYEFLQNRRILFVRLRLRYKKIFTILMSSCYNISYRRVFLRALAVALQREIKEITTRRNQIIGKEN